MAMDTASICMAEAPVEATATDIDENALPDRVAQTAGTDPSILDFPVDGTATNLLMDSSQQERLLDSHSKIRMQTAFKIQASPV